MQGVPWALLIFIGGLILRYGTQYHALGLLLMGVGLGLFILGLLIVLLFFLFALFLASR